ncbi:MAG: aquaporin family protein [Alistipes sp.]|nr:aquaporin family protein [Alistipes sp.]
METPFLTKCLFEFIGTLVLILIGDGVVANNCLKGTKGNNGGWIVITIAWGLAVMCGVLIAGPYSGAHLSPAVTLGFAVAGAFPWAHVAGYIAAQMLGAFCGATLVYIYYKDHYDITDDAVTKLGTFCTIPAIENKWRNFFCEVVATMLLIFVILAIGNAENTPEVGLGGIGSFPTAMLIMAVGMSLGGTTGYSLNPARDLGPRIAHALLPIKGKGGSDWGYSWVPVMGPLTGAALAALAYCAVYNF